MQCGPIELAVDQYSRVEGRPEHGCLLCAHEDLGAADVAVGGDHTDGERKAAAARRHHLDPITCDGAAKTSRRLAHDDGTLADWRSNGAAHDATERLQRQCGDRHRERPPGPARLLNHGRATPNRRHAGAEATAGDRRRARITSGCHCCVTDGRGELAGLKHGDCVAESSDVGGRREHIGGIINRCHRRGGRGCERLPKQRTRHDQCCHSKSATRHRKVLLRPLTPGVTLPLRQSRRPAAHPRR